MPESMRAAVLERPGGVEELKIARCAAPAPGEGQVQVEVAFAGCNWADTQVRQGRYPHPIAYPLIPGVEISGTIASLGPGVRGLEPGQRVCALPPKGGYAERVVVDRDDVMLVPDGIGLDTAAAFLIQGLTAYHLLHTVFRLDPGHVVLCHAIGGGVGSYVTQFAVKAGAAVVGTVGAEGKDELPLRLGAMSVINRAKRDFVEDVMAITRGEGVDLAIDSLGGATLDRTFTVVKNLGHVINIGEAEGVPFNNIRERLLPKSLTFTRFHLRHVGMRTARWRQAVEDVMRSVAEGSVEVPIFDRFPLERVADMHRTLEGRSVAGKLLLDLRSEARE